MTTKELIERLSTLEESAESELVFSDRENELCLEDIIVYTIDEKVEILLEA